MFTHLRICQSNAFTQSASKFAFLLSTLCFLFGIQELRAQPIANTLPEECIGGTLYYITYPDTVTNAQDARYADTRRSEFFLYIYSPVDQQIKIGRANGVSIARNIAAGDILEFDTREVAVPLISVRNSPQSNVLKVESESSIVVYAYMATPFGCAAFTPIPVESWGTKYFAATWPGEYVQDVRPAGENNFDATVKVPAPAEIVVIAAYDNTQLRIHPTASLAACANCQTVTLDRGEAYLVQSYVDTATSVEVKGDIAGTSISANKPIGVITANTRGWREPLGETLGANSFKDMSAEWLAPIGQHGTEFIFTPTWDDVRQRLNTSPMRTSEYVRIFPTTPEATDVSITADGRTDVIATGVKGGGFADERLEKLEQAIFYSTSHPAQAFQSPRPVTKFNGTTGSGSFIGASYKAWGTYAVEMTPREQWTSFAPIKAPSYPSGMKHYVNLITDSASQFKVYYRSGAAVRQLFPFSRGYIRTPFGTFVWGVIILNPGVNYTLEGDDGARFGGFVYGSLAGYELYRPGGAKDGDEKGNSASSAHPAEYEEELAMMYAYPIAPSRCVLAEPDQYTITTEEDGCGRVCVNIEPTNDTPAGLEFVRLVNDRTVTYNTRLEFIDPSDPRDVMFRARVCFSAIDPLKPARAILEVKDRTREGQVYQIPFEYDPEVLDISPSNGVDFGKISVGRSGGEKLITIVNPMQKGIGIKSLRLFFGNQEFTITRTLPAIDWTNPNSTDTLAPGDTLFVWVDIVPRDFNRVYHDSLLVTFGCSRYALSLDAAVGNEACLFVGNLDFGQVNPGQRKTLPLEICNLGDSEVSFHDSTATGGGAYLTWISTEFSVAQSEIDKLRSTVLGPGECMTILVSFSSELDGRIREIARIWASTRSCRDTSIWTAQVGILSGVEDQSEWAGYSIGTIAPNPFSRAAEITFALGARGNTRVEIYDTRGVLVTTLADAEMRSGEHRVEWNAEHYPAGQYYVRITSGDWSASRSLWLVR
ncbi:MAG: T9SS type A sorting domain-containing protein [Ignavibacteriae bacterium]|nr:T9SS type A sorting domain-containing protein [Ignavibacteriota bacterium]MCB9215021.1 T9SS type A sorting domain-containing protein [Ignavibacteria bacterium]